MREYSSLNRGEISEILRNICLKHGADESPMGINAIAAELKTQLTYPEKAGIQIRSTRTARVMTREIRLSGHAPFSINVPLLDGAA